MAEDAVVLGKRRQREADERRPSGSTLFVSNLPYTATSTDLKTLFSDFAPVRSAFVVLESNVSKGVGYVSFAIGEDAKTTLESVEKDGVELNGRTLRVQMADRKAKKTGEAKQQVPKLPRATHSKFPKDPNAIRTIVISGLSNSIDKKTLWKKVRKYEGAEIAELVEGEPGVAHVLFSTPATAAHAVEKLHAHVFKGVILSVTLKKRLENLAKAPAKNEGPNTSAAAPSRASRLIARNLPWDITEKDLRALFLPFGPIYSINIPMNEPSSDDSKANKAKLRAKGFAFVWFFSKKDAERAIVGINGRTVETGAIVAPTLNKKERQRLRRRLREEKETETREEEMDESSEEEEEKDEDEGALDGEPVKGSKPRGTKPRILAVDWALSKDKWEEAKAKTLGGQASGASESEAESGKESGSDEESESDGHSENDKEESESEMDVDEDDENDDERSDAEEVGKPTLPQTDVGTTIFVRNVPFDATEDELRVLFRTFGPLRYARITMDPETGRSRGTGFVCFWNKEDTDKAIHQSELLHHATGTSSSETPKKNPFSLPSLLTPDPSSSLAQSLVLHGRTLDVTRAVTRDEALKLKDENERQREKIDKRNLYLLREGVIFPNSSSASSLTQAELEKRQASFNTRRNLLKSNPSLYVSKTRLSIRQLPLFVTDRALKRLGVHAVRTFEEEMKRGEREPLSPEELRADEEVHGESGINETKRKKKLRKAKKGERDTGVKQAKVVRQADRVDALTGKGRSRGYGFLEMTRHTDALRVLRWANNNQAVGHLFEEWWKSEVESMIKALENTESKSKSKPKPDKDEDEGEDTEARVKRLKAELERLESGSAEGRKSRKALIIEFSIENVQVVNRRKEKIEAMKTASASKRARSTSVSVPGDNEEQESTTASPPKRRKIENSTTTATAAKGTTKSLKAETKSDGARAGTNDDKPTKPGKSIGSIIGRKRKMRKTRTKA